MIVRNNDTGCYIRVFQRQDTLEASCFKFLWFEQFFQFTSQASTFPDPAITPQRVGTDGFSANDMIVV
jgi:hypothetical protein